MVSQPTLGLAYKYSSATDAKLYQPRSILIKNLRGFVTFCCVYMRFVAYFLLIEVSWGHLNDVDIE